MQPEKFNAIVTTGIIITTVVYIIISYIIIRINYKPILDWATQQGAKNYKNKFNMFNLVAAKSNPIIYWVSNFLLTPPTARLTINQIRFLLSTILPNATFVTPDSGVQMGIVTLRSLAISVLPDYQNELSPDKIFDNWVDKGGPNGGHGQRGGYPVSASNTKKLKYIQATTPFKIPTEQAWASGTTLYSYVIDPDCIVDGHAPIWPAPVDQESWKGLIFEWLNGPNSTKSNLTTTPDPTSSGGFFFYWTSTDKSEVVIQENRATGGDGSPNGASKPMSQKYQYWFGPDNKSPPGDNWISRMGLPYNTPLIIGYVNNQYSIEGVIMDPQAFQNLVGGVSGDIAGGWVGYVQGLGEQISSDALNNIIKTSVEYTPSKAPPPCKKNAAGGIFGFLGPMLSAGLFALAAPEVALPMLAVGAVQGSIAAYQSQQC